MHRTNVAARSPFSRFFKLWYSVNIEVEYSTSLLSLSRRCRKKNDASVWYHMRNFHFCKGCGLGKFGVPPDNFIWNGIEALCWRYCSRTCYNAWHQAMSFLLQITSFIVFNEPYNVYFLGFKIKYLSQTVYFEKKSWKRNYFSELTAKTATRLHIRRGVWPWYWKCKFTSNISIVNVWCS